MSWKQLKRGTRDIGQPLRGVNVAIGRQGKSKHVARISLGADVLEAMGWKVDAQYHFHVGDGADFGKVLMAPAHDGEGYKLCAPKKSTSGTICVPTWGDLPNWPCRAQAAPWRKDDSGLVITLPEWPAAAPPAEPAPAGAGPVDQLEGEQVDVVEGGGEDPQADNTADPADDPDPLTEFEEEILGALIDHRQFALSEVAHKSNIEVETLRRGLRRLADKGYVRIEVPTGFTILRDLFGDPFKPNNEEAA